MSGSIPSRRRLSSASSECVRSTDETASVSLRLCSSGINGSKLLSPASRCATGTWSLTAASAPASVELTSPATTTRSGSSASITAAMRVSALAVCSAWLPEPTPRKMSGSGIPSSRKKMSDICLS